MKPTDESREFGKRITAIRTGQKLSQTAFAEKIGCTKNTVSRYETGETKMDVFTMKKIAETFNVRFEDFFPEFVELEENVEMSALWKRAEQLNGKNREILENVMAAMIKGLLAEENRNRS